MSKGQGADFSKGWLMKMFHNEVPKNLVTNEQIILDFKKDFLPMVKNSRALPTFADLRMNNLLFKGAFCF